MQKKKLSLLDCVLYLFLTIVLLISAYPLYFTIIASVSKASYVLNGDVWLLPKGLNFKAYENVVANSTIWLGYKNSLIYTVLGTLINLLINIPCAYALSKKRLSGKNLLMVIFVFTMFFNGGMIPNYLLMKNLDLINTRWALIVGFPLNVYNMIVCRTYYINSIPEDIYESCRIDGANEYRVFASIALPLSKPIIGVMTLFFAMVHWNSYFGALIYINSTRLYPLQLVLRNILILNEQMMFGDSMTQQDMLNMMDRMNIVEGMKYALIFFASAPVIIIYPFFQKYFAKGMMIGALKG